MLLDSSWTIEFSPSLVPPKAPASPRGVFYLPHRCSVAATNAEFQKRREAIGAIASEIRLKYRRPA